MMNLDQAIAHLTSWAQEELGGQRRMLSLLAEQEQAALTNDTEALLDATTRIEHELTTDSVREARRARLYDGFGRYWSLPPKALSLSSIAERAGQQGANVNGLERLRDDLRQAATEVQERARRLSLLTRAHRGVLEDLIGVLAGPSDGVQDGGRLLAVEA